MYLPAEPREIKDFGSLADSWMEPGRGQGPCSALFLTFAFLSRKVAAAWFLQLTEGVLTSIVVWPGRFEAKRKAGTMSIPWLTH